MPDHRDRFALTCWPTCATIERRMTIPASSTVANMNYFRSNFLFFFHPLHSMRVFPRRSPILIANTIRIRTTCRLGTSYFNLPTQTDILQSSRQHTIFKNFLFFFFLSLSIFHSFSSNIQSFLNFPTYEHIHSFIHSMP